MYLQFGKIYVECIECRYIFASCLFAVVQVYKRLAEVPGVARGIKIF